MNKAVIVREVTVRRKEFEILRLNGGTLRLREFAIFNEFHSGDRGRVKCEETEESFEVIVKLTNGVLYMVKI